MRLIIIILLGISLIFGLIGIITNKWYQSLSHEFNEGLWVFCQRLSSSSSINILNCRKQQYFKSQGLALSSFILLFIAFVLSIIFFYRKNDRLLTYLTVLILLGSTILLIFCYLLYPRNILFREFGYSIYCMLISSLIALITTGLVACTARTIQSTSTTTYFT